MIQIDNIFMNALSIRFTLSAPEVDLSNHWPRNSTSTVRKRTFGRIVHFLATPLHRWFGLGLLCLSVLFRGPLSENRAFINYGGEGLRYAVNNLKVRANIFENHGSWPSIGVHNRTSIPAEVSNNRFTAVLLKLYGSGTVNQSWP